MRAAIPEIDLDKCTGCGDCVEWCPAGVVRLASGKAAKLSDKEIRGAR